MQYVLRILTALGFLLHFLGLHAGASVGKGITVPLFPRPRSPSTSTLSYRNDNNISVANSHEYAYLARVEIGTQSFLVLIDTGSSDLWVVSSECMEEDCDAVAKYLPTSTLSPSNATFSLNYLLGAVSGQIGTELITLGPYQISSQVFGACKSQNLLWKLLSIMTVYEALANETTGLGLSGTGNSGILGLAFPLEAAIPDTSGRTLLENLFAAFDADDRYFAFKLGRDQLDSSFSVGQLDSAYANSTSGFAFNPVYSSYKSIYDYWKLPLQAITVNSTTFNLSRTKVPGAPSPIAVLDTGTTLILGPTPDVDRLWSSIGGARKTDAGWQVRCNRGIIIGFVLGQGDDTREFVLDPFDLSWRQGSSDNDWCMGGIQANDRVASGDWLLGDSFLRNVYAIHHVAVDGQPPKIGLLGTTDANSSLVLFQRERGADTTSPVPILASPEHQPTGWGSGSIIGLTVALSFLLGVLITCLIFYCVERKMGRR
ncbi:hypothetical protein QCA50_002895 [Cerrena zonata]|uniref:Peptidase A1 domain-containing protein n=1 Tax=Cerrena zonata TaxID=2478898 RepID=A0AAW0GTN2_9APHY